MSVMKGLIRHNRQTLAEYFNYTKDARMLRLLSRLNMCGRLHRDLVPFLWPSLPESYDYWSFHWMQKKQSKRELEVWQSADGTLDQIITNTDEKEKAISLLEKFDLLVCQGGGYVVPGVLAPGKPQIT